MMEPVRLNEHGQMTAIEAEHFDTCATSVAETDLQQGDSDYRATDVDLMPAAERSNGVIVTQMVSEEYLEYSLSVEAAGLYELTLMARVESQDESRVLVAIDGEASGSVELGAMPEWGAYTLSNLYFSGGDHVLRLRVAAGQMGLDSLELQSLESDTTSPANIVANMGTGINLGNTLDEPVGESFGATPEKESYFDAFKANGFGHVRIPVTWGGRTSETAPYMVDAQWLQRVENTVDWALARGLYVTINAHHEWWLKRNEDGKPPAYTPDKLPRITAIWRQVAEHFRYKPNRLLFELLNEPEDIPLDQVELANTQFLDVIRISNPSRAVVFSGTGYTPSAELLAVEIPNDAYLIGNFHSYDPYDFAGRCVKTWGSNDDRADLREIYQLVADWSELNGIPATVNEFGAALYDYQNPDNTCDEQDRLNYLKAHVELQKEFGIPGTVWDDDGSFRIYDRKTGSWDDALGSLIF